VIEHPAFTVEAWALRELVLDLDVLAQSESLFAVSNGHIGLRGNLDEGEPHGIPGTYLNGVYELRPLPYAEAGYGYPESSQTVLNVTNGKLIRLLVDDEPFDVRYGRLNHHERVLDFRGGTLDRRVEWVSPAGRTVKVHSTRLVSLTQRAVAAILYEVEAVEPISVVVQSELVANESVPDLSADPRSASASGMQLACEETVPAGCGAIMVHSTRRTGLRLAAAMHNDVTAPSDPLLEVQVGDDVGRVMVATDLSPGETLRIVKYVAYGWSGSRSRPALHDQVVAALAGARRSGWDGLLRDQRAFLDDYWAGADVEVDGDTQVQQAVRFGLFHVLQAAARAEGRPVPAKGLTGPGYDGHTFWDSETYVMPVLTYTRPAAAADALTWRRATIPVAEQHAASLGLQGAAFAWRTIAGEECSGYWPAGTAAFHVNADIADAVARYVDATGNLEFEEEVGVPLLVATARLWRSLGQHDMEGHFRIDGVTGPDEYSAAADNNVYTNLMAAQNLRCAADAVGRYPGPAAALGVSAEEAAAWRDAAEAVVLPFDARLGVHQQSEGFTDHAVWDFAGTGPDQYPLMLHFPYFDLYRKQVVKQADLVLAMVLQGEHFTPEQKRANFVYYEGLTVRDSSLSASSQSVMAAEVGYLDLAHDYLGESALIDLQDLEHNTRDGLHLAALAGTWTALVAGLGGMRARAGNLSFTPRLPEGISRLRFRVRYHGRRVGVDVQGDRVTYRILEGEPMPIHHNGRRVQVGSDPVQQDIPALTPAAAPRQPAGRRPAPRRTRPAGRGEDSRP